MVRGVRRSWKETLIARVGGRQGDRVIKRDGWGGRKDTWTEPSVTYEYEWDRSVRYAAICIHIGSL